MSAKFTNALVCVVAAAVLAFILGFALGNAFGIGNTFQLEKWQSLAGALVAIVAATVAFLGVRGTQRINVILKEQERLDKLLPGLRQANDFVSRLAEYLGQITARTRYMSIVVIRDYVQFKDAETFEEMVHRRVPLADDDTKRELTGLVVSLMQQAGMLKVAKDEHTKAYKDLAEIHLFAESSKPGVRQLAELLDASLNRQEAVMAAEIQSFRQASNALNRRVEEAKTCREIIATELDRFFREN